MNSMLGIRSVIVSGLAYTWASVAIAGNDALKSSVVASVERQKSDLVQMSDQIWSFAETALLENRSSKVLADYAEQQGFKVERGVSGMPHAFVAIYGSGKPIIGIIGEFYALPGLSLKAQPTKEPL